VAVHSARQFAVRSNSFRTATREWPTGHEHADAPADNRRTERALSRQRSVPRAENPYTKGGTHAVAEGAVMRVVTAGAGAAPVAPSAAVKKLGDRHVERARLTIVPRRGSRPAPQATKPRSGAARTGHQELPVRRESAWRGQRRPERHAAGRAKNTLHPSRGFASGFPGCVHRAVGTRPAVMALPTSADNTGCPVSPQELSHAGGRGCRFDAGAEA
jgi:hypothetical protein